MDNKGKPGKIYAKYNSVTIASKEMGIHVNSIRANLKTEKSYKNKFFFIPDCYLGSS